MDDFYDPLPTYAGNSPAIIQDKDDTELLESLLMDIDGPPLMVEPIPEIQTASVVPIKQEHEDIISQPLASEKPVAAGETKPQKRALGKDDEAKLLKKQRRLVRNRMSAQLHRERKKAQLTNLEQQLKQKTSECDALTNHVTELKLENASLRLQLGHFTGHSGSGESTPPSSQATTDESSPDDSSMSDDSSSLSPPQSPQPLSGTARGAILFSFVISFVIFGDPILQNSVDTDIQSRLLAAPPQAHPENNMNRHASATAKRNTQHSVPSPYSSALVPKYSSSRRAGARVLTSMELDSDREANAKENQITKAQANTEVPWRVGRGNQLYPPNNDTVLNSIAQSKATPLSVRNGASPQHSTSSTKTLRGRSTGTSVSTTMVESKQVEWKNFPGSKSSDFTLPESEDRRRNSASSYIFCPEAYGTVNIWSGEDVAVSEYATTGTDGKRAPKDAGCNDAKDAGCKTAEQGSVKMPDIEKVLAGGQYYRDAGMKLPGGGGYPVDNSRALAPIAPKVSHPREPLQAPTPEGTDYSGEGQQHPYMLMLVPTKSVRWGGRALNNDSTDGSSSGSEGQEDEEATTTWLEIGCQVLHARVVSNVKFTAM